MSKAKKFLIAILLIAVLILIGWNITDSDNDVLPVITTEEPVYYSQHTISTMYEPTGKLQYKLVSDDVKYYSEQETGWFQNPFLTLFDQNTVAAWTINSDKAKLTKDRMLYLYGNVKVSSLQEDSQLKRIITDNAIINLNTLDVYSDDEVTLSGIGFSSTGMKMRGNLRTRNAELIEKVNTRYEIQN